MTKERWLKLNIRTELWARHEIRFVEKEGEWWAVAVDVTKALGLKQTTRAISRLKDGVTISKVIDNLGREQEVNIINEKAIYKLAFTSHKPEAEEFQDWVYEMLKQLRQSTGLEGFQVFRMLDKEHQKEAMAKLKHLLKNPVQVNYIKANTITNKVVSTKYGYPKMIKKGEMTPDMLTDRQVILDCTVELMGVKEKYGLDFSVSDEVNKVVKNQSHTA